MCDSSRILMSPRLGSEKDEEEVHKNEFHYYFLSSSSFILDSYFGFFKLEETLVQSSKWRGVTPEVATTKIKGIEKEMRCQFSKVHDYSVAIGKSSLHYTTDINLKQEKLSFSSAASSSGICSRSDSMIEMVCFFRNE